MATPAVHEVRTWESLSGALEPQLLLQNPELASWSLHSPGSPQPGLTFESFAFLWPKRILVTLLMASSPMLCVLMSALTSHRIKKALGLSALVV